MTNKSREINWCIEIPSVILDNSIWNTLPFNICAETASWITTVFNIGDKISQNYISRFQAAWIELKISKDDEKEYFQYVQEILPKILADNSINLESRNNLFLKNLYNDLIDTFKNKIPKDINNAQLKRFQDIAFLCVDTLKSNNSLLWIKELFIHNHVTYKHCLSVFTLALPLIRKRVNTKKELFNRWLWALLHDIWKLRIPNEILDKPWKLSDNEFEIIKDHPWLWYRHCIDLPLWKETVDAIFLHHEKYNWTGYPFMLKWSQIPEPIRIITIADIFDALCSKRPYCWAMAPIAAIKMMKEKMSDELDPNLFKEFCEMLYQQWALNNEEVISLK